MDLHDIDDESDCFAFDCGRFVFVVEGALVVRIFTDRALGLVLTVTVAAGSARLALIVMDVDPLGNAIGFVLGSTPFGTVCVPGINEHRFISFKFVSGISLALAAAYVFDVDDSPRFALAGGELISGI